jgi:hypothetical protein
VRRPQGQRPVESAQDLSIRYSERLTEIGLKPSTGSVGDCYDNALAETIIGLYKAEVIHHRWPWRALEAVENGLAFWDSPNACNECVLNRRSRFAPSAYLMRDCTVSVPSPASSMMIGSRCRQ